MLSILLALAASGEQAPLHINRLPGPLGRIEGPRDVCTEEFSVRLTAGEAISWNGQGGGNVFYRLHSGGMDMNVGRWPGALPVEGPIDDLGLPGSPVAQRRAHRMGRLWLSTANSPKPRRVRAWRVEYLLYGTDRAGRPLTISTYSSDPDLSLPIAGRVSLGSMEERGCRTPTRLEPGITVPPPPAAR